MQKWILLTLISLMTWQVQAQRKKRINIYELDLIKGLYFQPNTIKPYTGTAFDKFPNKKKRIEIPIKDGKVHGKTKEWAKNGKKLMEANYVNGVQHGKETQWYVIGKKKVEVNYVNGKVEGTVIEWYKSGEKKSEGIFRNGKEEGEHQWWHDNGKLDQVINYENGLAQGVVKNWFRNGKIRFETNFKDGQKNGSSIEWFANGQKFSEANFKNNKEDGKSYVWNKQGMPVREDTFEDGKLVNSKNYLSGSIYAGDGYWQVFNEMSDFFILKISGNTVRTRKAEEITYVVDGDLLQIFNQPIGQYFKESFSNTSDTVLLKEYIKKEAAYISSATKFEIEVEKENGTTTEGKDYVHWHFVSPSSKDADQKPRTVQEEHYISFICGDRILSLYGVVTNNDTPPEIITMLTRIAKSLSVKNERIDLNALAATLQNKK